MDDEHAPDDDVTWIVATLPRDLAEGFHARSEDFTQAMELAIGALVARGVDARQLRREIEHAS